MSAETTQEHKGGPSRDVIKNVLSLNASTELLHRLCITTLRVDDMYYQIDPGQYAVLLELKQRMNRGNPTCRMFSVLDDSIFHGKSIIYNRETALHADSKDPKSVLTPILTLGKYTWGRLDIPVLGMSVSYDRRTLVLLRGAELPHAVRYGGGFRISVANFLHGYTLKEYGLEGPPVFSMSPPDRWEDEKDRDFAESPFSPDELEEADDEGED